MSGSQPGLQSEFLSVNKTNPPITNFDTFSDFLAPQVSSGVCARPGFLRITHCPFSSTLETISTEELEEVQRLMQNQMRLLVVRTVEKEVLRDLRLSLGVLKCLDGWGRPAYTLLEAGCFPSEQDWDLNE